MSRRRPLDRSSLWLHLSSLQKGLEEERRTTAKEVTLGVTWAAHVPDTKDMGTIIISDAILFLLTAVF